MELDDTTQGQHGHDDHDDHDDDQAPAAKRSRVSVACDQCRRKKVKCNGGLPCENCRRGALACTYQAPKKRTTTKSGTAADGSTRGSELGDGHDHDDDHSSHPGGGGAGGSGGSTDPDDLAEMMTFLVSLEENGGINALRSLGSSSGMHLLRMWSDRVTEGVLVVPAVSKKHTPRGPEADLPPREIIDLLLEFFFENLHPFMPIVEKAMIFQSLAQSNPPLMLLNSIFAVSSRVYEGLSQERSDKPGASDIFLNRARQIARNILLEPPCLEHIQALMLLSFHELGFLRGSTWLVSGVSIRMAMDIGLNRRMDHLSGALSITPLQSHLMKKTWAAVFIMDRFVSAVLGRPLAIQDEDCDAEWPSPDDERQLSGDAGAQLLADYVQLAKLCTILGRILRNLNSVRNHTRGRLAFSLPEIHKSLSTWFSQLPPHMHYSFNASAPRPSRFAAFTNCLYYASIILLYRPFVSSAKARTSKLFPQYLHICSTAAQAIVHICHNRLDEFFLLPSVVLYTLFTAITTLVITYNYANEAAASSDTDPHAPNSPSNTRANSLTALMKCLVVLSTLQEIWPMANRIGFMLEDFFSSHRIPIPADAKKLQVLPERTPPAAAECSNKEAINDAYSRLRTAAETGLASPAVSMHQSPAAAKSPSPFAMATPTVGSGGAAAAAGLSSSPAAASCATSAMSLTSGIAVDSNVVQAAMAAPENRGHRSAAAVAASAFGGSSPNISSDGHAPAGGLAGGLFAHGTVAGATATPLTSASPPQRAADSGNNIYVNGGFIPQTGFGFGALGTGFDISSFAAPPAATMGAAPASALGSTGGAFGMAGVSPSMFGMPSVGSADAMFGASPFQGAGGGGGAQPSMLFSGGAASAASTGFGGSGGGASTFTPSMFLNPANASFDPLLAGGGVAGGVGQRQQPMFPLQQPMQHPASYLGGMGGVPISATAIAPQLGTLDLEEMMGVPKASMEFGGLGLDAQLESLLFGGGGGASSSPASAGPQ